jgi:hypothetical protein
MSKAYQSKITKQKADSNEYHKIFNKWRMYDLWTTIFAMIGLSVMIVNYEIDVWFFGIQTFYMEDIANEDMVLRAMTSDRYTSFHTKALRWIVALTSIAAIFSLLMRHKYKILWLNRFFTTIQRESQSK